VRPAEGRAIHITGGGWPSFDFCNSNNNGCPTFRGFRKVGTTDPTSSAFVTANCRHYAFWSMSRGERRCESGKSLDPGSRNAQPSKIAKAGAAASWCDRCSKAGPAPVVIRLTVIYRHLTHIDLRLWSPVVPSPNNQATKTLPNSNTRSTLLSSGRLNNRPVVFSGFQCNLIQQLR